ncbi:hypothetical protein Aduo_008787 [Ancylostoma duodenale]
MKSNHRATNLKLVNPWRGLYLSRWECRLTYCANYPKGCQTSQFILRKAEGKEVVLEKRRRMNDPLNLRYRCGCDLLGQMAHVPISGFKHPTARSDKVLDMFQLANVASTSEQHCWGDARKGLRARSAFPKQ